MREKFFSNCFLIFALHFLCFGGAYANAFDYPEDGGIPKRNGWISRHIANDLKPRTKEKDIPYEMLARASTLGCDARDAVLYMANLMGSPHLEGKGATDIDIFLLPPFVRYLYKYGHCFNSEQLKSIARDLSVRRPIFSHGTINHALLQSTSWYLLAQYFPNLSWIDADGQSYTSAQVMKRIRGLLLARFKGFYDVGQYEFYSPTYAMINFFPLLNLFDFADDEEIRSSSNRQAILQLALLKSHSYKGVVMPPLTRLNFKQNSSPATNSLDLRPAVTQQLLWYYFGQPKQSFYDLDNDVEPFYIIMLSLSSWSPPPEIASLGNSIPRTEKLLIPAFGYWGKSPGTEIFGSTTIGDGFYIGLGNANFDVAGYNADTQLFGIGVAINDSVHQIDCVHPYWRSNAGEDAWGQDLSSPFMQGFLNKGEGVLLFSIPDSDPWVFDKDNRFFALRSRHAASINKFFQCRIPSVFEEIVKGPDFVFLRIGQVFIYFKTLNGENEYSRLSIGGDSPSLYDVFKVREPHTGLFFRVESGYSVSDFNDFKKRMSSLRFDYSVDSDGVRYVSNGIFYQIKFSGDYDAEHHIFRSIPRVLRHGVELVNDSDYVLNASDLILKGGFLSIKTGNESHMYEFK